MGATVKNIILVSFCSICSLFSDEENLSKIIYLNGPSSSEKTTLAKALQEALSEPYLHVGIDKMIGFMPAKVNIGFSWEAATDSTGHSIYNIHAGPFAKKVTHSLKDIAHLLASQHYNLIIDDVAFGAIEVEEWKKVLEGYKVLYIGGGENRTLVLSKLPTNDYMLSVLEIVRLRCRMPHK